VSLLCWLSVMRRLVRSVDHGDAACSGDERRRFIYAQEQRIHRGQPLRLAK
jgi:hypothetical protein